MYWAEGVSQTVARHQTLPTERDRHRMLFYQPNAPLTSGRF